MSVRVRYDATTAFGQMLAEAVTEMRAVHDKLRRLDAVMYAMAEPEAVTPTFSAVDTEFGSTAAGETLYNLVHAWKLILDTVPFADLDKLDQG